MADPIADSRVRSDLLHLTTSNLIRSMLPRRPDHLFPVRIFLTILLGVLVFPSQILSAQGIPIVGSPDTFDIGTWNVEWFGNTSNGPSDENTQFQHVKEVLQSSAVDLWALQEVASPSIFQQLLTELGPDWNGDLATNSGTQRVAFVYRTDTITKRSVKHILESFTSIFASRPPLEIQVTVTLPQATATVTLITVHMKAFADATSYQKRVDAAARLKNHIEFTNLASEPVVIMGDFNDELNASTYANQPSPYAGFLSDPQSYFFPTLTFEQGNLPTWCSNGACTFGSTIDHILITNELEDRYVSDSVARLEELVTVFPNYRNNTSDHLPVVARFSFATATDTDADPVLPTRTIIRSVFPNPVVRDSRVEVSLASPSDLRVELYDILGRKITSLTTRQPAGIHEINLPTELIGPGWYTVRISSGTRIETRSLLKVRR